MTAHSLARHLALASLVVAGVLLGMSCINDESAEKLTPAPLATEASPTATLALPTASHTPAPPTAAATATPTPVQETPPPVTAWPTGTRTGEALVDRVIDLVEEQDWVGLAALAEWTTYPCEGPRPIQPQPLLCRDGMQPGDPLTGFWVSDVEGALWPPDRERLAAAFGEALSAARLHAVYAYGPDEQKLMSLPATRVDDVVFVATDDRGRPFYPNFELSDTGLIRFDFRFALLPYSKWTGSAAGGWLLARAP